MKIIGHFRTYERNESPWNFLSLTFIWKNKCVGTFIFYRASGDNYLKNLIDVSAYFTVQTFDTSSHISIFKKKFNLTLERIMRKLNWCEIVFNNVLKPMYNDILIGLHFNISLIVKHVYKNTCWINPMCILYFI